MERQERPSPASRPAFPLLFGGRGHPPPRHHRWRCSFCPRPALPTDQAGIAQRRLCRSHEGVGESSACARPRPRPRPQAPSTKPSPARQAQECGPRHDSVRAALRASQPAGQSPELHLKPAPVLWWRRGFHHWLRSALRQRVLRQSILLLDVGPVHARTSGTWYTLVYSVEIQIQRVWGRTCGQPRKSTWIAARVSTGKEKAIIVSGTLGNSLEAIYAPPRPTPPYPSTPLQRTTCFDIRIPVTPCAGLVLGLGAGHGAKQDTIRAIDLACLQLESDGLVGLGSDLFEDARMER